jgi:sugar-specific transcriptional regulator TrmB/DNA-binding CsgD family transcriptional regulator
MAPGVARKTDKLHGANHLPPNENARHLMNEQMIELGPVRPLEVLGISELEERAYSALLAHPASTVDALAMLLSTSSRKTQHLLDQLEEKGLASRSPERPRRYIASAPKLAVEALISQRQVMLELARSTIPELAKRVAYDKSASERENVVELITNKAALGQIFSQIHLTTENEIVVFQRPPILHTTPEELIGVRKALRIRTVSDSAFLSSPGAMDLIRRDVVAGEEARVYPVLPTKMVVADRRIGLIPLNPAEPDGDVLLVRSSSLLDSLYALFEFIWEHATPIVFASTGGLKTSAMERRLTDVAEQVLGLLAAGLNDKTIAHEAGISEATLTRRVNDLMKRFSTRTRFQLGWRAALEMYSERAITCSAEPITK